MDYRLAPVRDARAREARTRVGELADTIADASRAAEAVAAADRRIEAARARLDAATSAGATAQLTALADRFRARLRRDLERACTEREHLADAQRARDGAVDEARGRFAWARARKELIERHFERWRLDQRKLAERRAD